jgi:hypothetical protein
MSKQLSRLPILGLLLALLLGLVPMTQAGVTPNTLTGLVSGDCSSATITGTRLGGTFEVQVTSSLGLNETYDLTAQIPATGVVTSLLVTFPLQLTGNIITITGINDTTGTVDYFCIQARPIVPVPLPLPFFEDQDSDVVINGLDNCPFIANRGQEDGWGGPEGDACDENYYNGPRGAKAFQQKDGSFDIYGNCIVGKCSVVANISERDLSNILTPPDFRRFTSPTGGGWYVDVYFLGRDLSGALGNLIYQVNIHDVAGRLIDDSLQLIISPSGMFSFRTR